MCTCGGVAGRDARTLLQGRRLRQRQPKCTTWAMQCNRCSGGFYHILHVISHSKPSAQERTWPSSPPPTVTSGRRKAMSAASAARPQASIRLPWWSNTCKSTRRCHTLRPAGRASKQQAAQGRCAQHSIHRAPLTGSCPPAPQQGGMGGRPAHDYSLLADSTLGSSSHGHGSPSPAPNRQPPTRQHHQRLEVHSPALPQAALHEAGHLDGILPWPAWSYRGTVDGDSASRD